MNFTKPLTSAHHIRPGRAFLVASPRSIGLRRAGLLLLGVSLALWSHVVGAQTVGCCESYYYCYDLTVQEGPACQVGQSQEWAAPYACNLWTQQCDVPALSAESCLGDCDKDGIVNVSEVIRAVNFALGSPTAICAGFGSPDGIVGIDGLIHAVGHVLSGCPRQTAHCGGGPSRTNASLCGPPDRPCTILVDNTPPGSGIALAVDSSDRPALLTADDVLAVSYAELSSDGVWHSAPTGFSGAAVWLDVSDAPLALVNSITSDSHVDLWRRDENHVWQHIDTAPGVLTETSGVQRDAGGCLHALTSTLDPRSGLGALAYAVHTDDWSYLGYVTKPSYPGFGALGLDGTGDPFITYWQPAEGDPANRTLLWKRPFGPAESVASVGARFILSDTARVAFSGKGVGQPHILATRSFPGFGDQFGTELIYATRSGPGPASARVGATEVGPMWSVQAVAQGSADEFNPWRCEAPPYPGSVCPFSYDYVRALGLVASENGDVRLIYVRQHVEGRVVADCSFGTCRAHSESSMDGTLYVAWPENGSLSQMAVLEHLPYDRGTTVLDAHGHIHIIAAGYAASRYLVLGASS